VISDCITSAETMTLRKKSVASARDWLLDRPKTFVGPNTYDQGHGHCEQYQEFTHPAGTLDAPRFPTLRVERT